MGAWLSVTQLLQQLVQTVAIVVGGLWAYFKFFRGRTFAYRVELTMEPRLVQRPTGCYLHATVTLRNSGQARVPLHVQPRLSVLIVHAIQADAWRQESPPDWGEPLHIEPMLVDHDSIEPGETVVDDVILPLPPGSRDEWIAIRIVGQIWAERSFWRREWRSQPHPSERRRRFLSRRNHQWVTVRVIPMEEGTDELADSRSP